MKQIFYFLLVLIVVSTVAIPKAVQSASASLEAALATDDFGYSVSEAAVEWINASDSLGSASKVVWGPVDLGFTFKFYGLTYTSVYVSGNGLLSFNNDPFVDTPIDTYLPKIIYPNNLIAPFWIALKGGTVRYKAGGTAPDRYFIVEYNNVRLLNGDPISDLAWFEVILYENNNIAWTYFVLPGVKSCHAGIEDETGWYGLPYNCSSINTRDLNSYLFTYPAPAPRVKLTPPVQSAFGSTGGTISFLVTVLNAGDQGSDRFDFTVTSPWPVTLYKSNSTTPLTDTDASGKVDTGPLVQNTSTDIIAKVSIPGDAGVGDNAQINLEARFKLDSNVKKTTLLQAAVPAPFAQVFRDDINKAMQLERIEPGLQAAHKVTADGEGGKQMAVVETPTGNLVYAWSAGRYNSNSKGVSEIKYTSRYQFVW